MKLDVVVTGTETQRDVVTRELRFHATRAMAYLSLMTASNSAADFDDWKAKALTHLTGCHNPFAVPDEPYDVAVPHTTTQTK